MAPPRIHVVQKKEEKKVKKDVNSLGTSKTYNRLILFRKHPNSF